MNILLSKKQTVREPRDFKPKPGMQLREAGVTGGLHSESEEVGVLHRDWLFQGVSSPQGIGSKGSSSPIVGRCRVSSMITRGIHKK